MDLEAYIGRYKGESRLQRLLWIARQSPDKVLVKQAFDLAQQQMKQDGNIVRYKDIFQPEGEGGSGLAPRLNVQYDAEFAMEAESSNRASRDTLTSRLSAAQSQLNKEAIRTAYLALAEADILRGELTEALHSSLRAKDYCTNRAQTAQVSFLILELAVHLQNYPQVKDFCLKVQHTLLPEAAGGSSSTSTTIASSSSSTLASPQGVAPTAATQQVIADKLLIASALERLAHQDFDEAAKKFRKVCCREGSSSSPVEWDTLIAPEDVATYAAITSLATANRKELVELSEHPEALELVPQLRQALFQFGRRSNYKACLAILDEMKPSLALDLFLAPHLGPLLQKIREACILEYWLPFQRVQLIKMATDLDMDVGDLQTNLSQLIAIGLMKDCRMDCRSMTLIREEEDPDAAPIQAIERKMHRVGKQMADDVYSMMIAMACLESDLTVTDPNQGDRRQHLSELSYTSSDEDTPMVDAGGQANPEDLY